ncbi:MAG: ubiquinol-cytochrome c reductase iron-sulfur subunit [Nitrospirae bacterium]|nr:ubiquinol-cytochrome c reductase iron-sulfur subunit [Nitrospirota bacterium]
MLERRGFVVGLTGTIIAAIGAVVGIPLVGYTILPALRKRPETWTDAGPVAELVHGQPRELRVLQTVSDGWLKGTVAKSVWAVKQATGEVLVYSGLCTHLGCGFRWNPQTQQFQCPCHTAAFALDGRVLGGPPPRPLDTLPAKVENGRLLVIYKEFKAGAVAKIEI